MTAEDWYESQSPNELWYIRKFFEIVADRAPEWTESTMSDKIVIRATVATAA